ncbi:MAG: hypothetical protein Fur0014_11910 [Rubrivivax sp.]
MSPYQRIVDGVKYPAVLFTHGVCGPCVDVWQSSQAAARLQAAGLPITWGTRRGRCAISCGP